MSVMNLAISDYDISAIEAAREERSPFVRAIIAGFEERCGSQASIPSH
jgi:hypothetical protein